MDDKKFLKQLGLRMRCLLIMAEIKTTELASKTGLTKNTLNSIMSGKSNLTILNLKKISDALGTDIKELL